MDFFAHKAIENVPFQRLTTVVLLLLAAYTVEHNATHETELSRFTAGISIVSFLHDSLSEEK